VLKSVLVTGGCGFIGANLVRELASGGTAVRVLDNMSRGHRLNLQNVDVEIIEGDVRSPQTGSRSLRGVEAVVHLAAFGSVVESVTGLAENFDVNVHGTVIMLQEAVKHGIQKFVFASSGGAVIGRAAPPVSEHSLAKPVSPYGASKLCGEAYCHAFAGTFGLQTVALRFANVYGPYSAHKRGAVTNFILALLSGEPMVIFGDGSATRDFIYVNDLCDGICAALNTELQPGTVLHLATGVETTIGELARTLAKVANRDDYPIRFEQKRAGELERNFAKSDLAGEMLGFKSRVTLAEGLESTLSWFQRQPQAVVRTTRTDS
jgi:UDP-glucose 4-epimerase